MATLLTFDGSTLTVDLDLDEPVDILKWQIFSLTEVPVEEQRLWCNMKQGLLFDDDDLKQVVGSGAGVVLILLPSPVGPEGTVAAPLPEEEWRYCCTRVCAGADAKVMQVCSESDGCGSRYKGSGARRRTRTCGLFRLTRLVAAVWRGGGR